MYVRDLDVEGFKRIRQTETFLRRMVRWELRGNFGSRGWYSELGSISDDLEARIRIERDSDLYVGAECVLSYLETSEMMHLIFDSFWDTIFQEVLKSRRSLKHNELKSLRRVRNRIAHFRSIGSAQFKKLSEIDSVMSMISDHYKNHVSSVAYIPGAFDRSEEQIDPDEVDSLTKALEEYSLEAVWDEFQRIEVIRTNGLSPGIGIVNHHVFFEVFTKGSFRSDILYSFMRDHEHGVTFMNVGAAGDFVRIFVPIRDGSREIRRMCKKLVKQLQLAVSNDLIEDEAEAIRAYDFGINDALNGESINTCVGFIF